MDLNQSGCSFSTSASFIKESIFNDYYHGWFVTKSKKKNIKGTWNIRTFRKVDSPFFDEGKTFAAECGVFRYNKKKDVLRLYVSGKNGCFMEEAKGGRKQFLGKLKVSDAEDLFNEESGTLQITTEGSVSRKNDDYELKIDNMMLFKSSSKDDSNNFAVHIDESYMKGLGKFERKMDIEGELQTPRGGMTLSNLEDNLSEIC